MYFYYFCLLSTNKKSISTKTNIIFNNTSVVLSQIQWEGILYWVEIYNINFIIKNTRDAIRICTKNTRNAICIKNVHWNATLLLF